MKKYKILIVPQIKYTEQSQKIERPYEIELDTERLDWSMDQYQRNRDPFNFKILSIDGNKTDNSSSL